MKFYTTITLLFLLTINRFNCFSQQATCQHLRSGLATTNSLYYSSENLRSDTFDVLNYTINLDITDFTNKIIRGNTEIKLVPKINGQSAIQLDLLKLTIDSIKQTNSLLTYQYNDTIVTVNLLNTLTITDTTYLTIYYHGTPQGDPAGWGGFAFDGNYAYNLGVGFGAKPHNYGRVWFPCFDNFVERSTYEFNITTAVSKTAYCNGTLISDNTNGVTRTRKWILNKSIPSYLASVTVADYKQINWQVNAANGILPITLAARASDTTALKTGFVHLPNAILGFENYYGPYVWNKVGYSLVPFAGGAMEHATNIAYPQPYIGDLSSEADLMAHELAHHWWGNLMTCETQEDMWLNEGMASYSERLFLEWTYSYAKYIEQVKSIHDDLVKHTHLKEAGFRAISGIPHEYTYGEHVYRKGADVAHTLRSYMGDVAFFAGLKYVLQQKTYKSMNSLEFRDLLQTSSGQNLTHFFNDWVLNGGWTHFSIDSVKTIGTSAPYTSTVYVKQKLFGAPHLYNNVPLELTFMNTAWAKEIKPIIMSGTTQSFTIQTTLLPVFTGINVDSKISDAISSEYKTIKTNATINYSLGRATFLVSNKGLDSSYVRVEHNFASADSIKNNINNFRLNTQHYWKIDGILSVGFISKLRLFYDGTKNPSGNSYLDTCLTITNGDSLILLYRKNTNDDWREVRHYNKFKLSAKTGFVTADTLKLGEYVFANGRSAVITDIENQKNVFINLEVFPNPAYNQLNIIIQNYDMKPSNYFNIYDIQGKLVMRVNAINSHTKIGINTLPAGNYTVSLIEHNDVLVTKKIVIQN